MCCGSDCFEVTAAFPRASCFLAHSLAVVILVACLKLMEIKLLKLCRQSSQPPYCFKEYRDRHLQIMVNEWTQLGITTSNTFSSSHIDLHNGEQPGQGLMSTKPDSFVHWLKRWPRQLER